VLIAVSGISYAGAKGVLMHKIFRPISVVAIAAALLLCGCDVWIFNAKTKNSTTTPANIMIIGTPVINASTVTISVTPLSADSTVILLNGSNTCFYIDSVKTSSGASASYTIKTSGVVNSHTNAGTIARIASQMIFDGSGSIIASDPYNQRRIAAKNYMSILAAKNPKNKVAIAEFGRNDSLGYNYYFNLWCDFTSVSNTALLYPFIDSLSSYGSTPLYSSIRRGIEHTDSLISASQYIRSVIVFTDGEDNNSSAADSVGSVLNFSLSKAIPIFIVALGDYSSLDIMRNLSWSSGGLFIPVDSANVLSSVFSTLATSISSGYSNIKAQLNRVPDPGDTLYMSIMVISGGQRLSRPFTVIVPVNSQLNKRIKTAGRFKEIDPRKN